MTLIQALPIAFIISVSIVGILHLICLPVQDPYEVKNDNIY